MVNNTVDNYSQQCYNTTYAIEAKIKLSYVEQNKNNVHKQILLRENFRKVGSIWENLMKFLTML